MKETKLAGYSLQSDFFRHLERLTFLVADVYESLGAFDAIADNSADLTKRGVSRSLRYVQALSIDRMILCFAKATSDKAQDVSFKGTTRWLTTDKLVDIGPIHQYLKVHENFVASKPDNEVLNCFRRRIISFQDDGFGRLTLARNKFIAHLDTAAKWEDVGANFADIERFILIANARVDACYFSFFDLSKPVRPLSDICRERADKTVRSLRKLIESVVVAER